MTHRAKWLYCKHSKATSIQLVNHDFKFLQIINCLTYLFLKKIFFDLNCKKIKGCANKIFTLNDHFFYL